MSDHKLRRLHRLWLVRGTDEDAQNFMHEYSRVVSPDAFDPAEKALIDLLVSHTDEHGVHFNAANAAVSLLGLLLNQEAVLEYGQHLGGVENRSYLSPEDLESLLKHINLQCGHHTACDGGDVKCSVVGCVCPGCFDTSMLNRTGRRPTMEEDVCYHHWQLFSSLGEDDFFQHYSMVGFLDT